MDTFVKLVNDALIRVRDISFVGNIEKKYDLYDSEYNYILPLILKGSNLNIQFKKCENAENARNRLIEILMRDGVIEDLLLEVL